MDHAARRVHAHAQVERAVRQDLEVVSIVDQWRARTTAARVGPRTVAMCSASVGIAGKVEPAVGAVGGELDEAKVP